MTETFPRRKSSASLAGRLLRGTFAFLQRVDRRDPLFLRWIPPRVKRRLVGRFWRPMAARMAHVQHLDGLEIEVPPEMRYMYVVREFEPATQRCLDRLLEPGRTAVDVGANIGFLTARMARSVGPEGRIWALEPEPANLEILRRNMKRNGLADRVRIVPQAAGAGDASRRLYLGGHGMGHSFHPGEAGPTAASVEVRQSSLDDLVEGPVDLVKIDVEGAELDVLAGMDRLLAENPDLHLVVEWNPAAQRAAGHTGEALPRRLLEAGFRLVLIPESDGPETVQEALHQSEEDLLPRRWYANLHGTRQP